MSDIEKRARELRELIDQYWSLAYAEGAEGRMHDTEAGDAQRVSLEIDSAIRAITALTPPEGYVLVPVGQEPVYFYVCDACGHHYMEDGITCDCTPEAVQPPLRHVRMLAARPEVK